MLNGLSLFANVGIAETYLSEVGINVVVANELLEPRAKFYKHLYPNCNMVVGDITEKAIFEEVKELSIKNNVEFIIATPPCQGMSIAGAMNPYDERNSLVKYAIDMIEIIKPKFVLLENVTRQLITPIQYKSKEILIPEYIEKRLGKYYNFNKEKVINSADYGVPQRRERAIILMTRKDQGFTWEFPEKYEKRICLEEIFNDIPDLWPIIREKEYKDVLPKNTKKALSYHKWHKPPTQCWRNTICMLYTPTGNTAFDNKVYYPKKSNGEKVKGYNTTYHRMFWDKPAPTITRYNGVVGSQNNVHPGKPWKKDKNGDMMYTNPRVLTIYELIKASSLPDDWNIPDWASDDLIRHVIGEGIPPLLIKEIVKVLWRK